MSGTQVIRFNEVPVGWEVPGTFLEVSPVYDRLGILPFPARNLIVAQMTAAGSAAVNTVYTVTRVIQATQLFGAGSEAELAVKRYFQSNTLIPLDVIAVAEPVGGTAAIYTVTLTDTALIGGTLPVEIAGQRVSINGATGDTLSTWASNLIATINAVPGLPVTATNTVTTGSGTASFPVVCKNKGVSGNDLLIQFTPARGDIMPRGMTAAVTRPTAGVGVPDFSGAIAAIGHTQYSGICIQAQDSANLLVWGGEMARRFNAMTHLDGKVYTCFTGSMGQMLSKIAAVNSQFVNGICVTAPGSMPIEYAAAAMAACEKRGLADPSLQMGGLVLTGVVGPQALNAMDDSVRNALLLGGGSTLHVRQDRSVSIEKMVTTYATDAQGNPDYSWHDIMEVMVAIRIRYDWRVYRNRLYPANKMAPDGSTAAENDPTIVTPKRMTGSWAARLLAYAQVGWIMGEQDSARSAVFQINPTDKNRMDAIQSYNRIGNLMVLAGKLQFEVVG